jgi:sec-independent protein translocase protein TatA
MRGVAYKLLQIFVPLYIHFKEAEIMLNSIFLIAGLGTTEIILILAVVLLMFGGKKIPELMRGLGKGVKEYKDASKGEGKEGELPKEEK